mgnify:CR=1 FL=1
MQVEVVTFAILVNTEMIILKGAVKAAASAGSVTGKVVNKARAFSLPTDSILYETTISNI